jgi:hypothetical protein
VSDVGFPRFRKKSVAPRFQPATPGEFFRGTSRERGYDRRWDQFSVAYRRQNPFCAECESLGIDRVCDVVDHMVPLADGGEKFDVQNVWSLCNPHHNGMKRDLERYARANGLLHELPKWCRDPESRPPKFRQRRS